MKKFTKIISICIGIFVLFVFNNVYAADFKRGQELVKEKNCASCHGADFTKTISPAYPKLAGQKEDYLYYALNSYKSNDKNYGRTNPIMQGQVATLSSKDMKDIAAYLSNLPSKLILVK